MNNNNTNCVRIMEFLYESYEKCECLREK